ncbi:hypothetical protein MXMO3_00075 [Maritalea myrionectae]|uniref:Uncharacterized protein n=1 Tax=Maritalea myrionectae TaxID=454601 RepID=A0A2R4M9H6_9HYPH|nr:hypothetical protein [Maritalea myrionectae]AVX02623.1 hypothetical protein MXMO3_00075 [Maritalea myrionectae]
MLSMPKNLKERYAPLYFLASVGAGGLVVTFFMYLMFWVPHPGQPVPVFEDIVRAYASANMPLQIAITIALMGIALLAILHFRLLAWNLREYSKFRETEAFRKLKNSNAETQLIALPLTLAMAVNVAFIVGLVFVPGLWSIVEFLFPAAIATFALIGLLALNLFGKFLARIFAAGGFDQRANNSFAQVLPAFAFAMISVGFAAPAALSQSKIIVGVGVALAGFFFIAAVLIALVAAVIGLNSILQNGLAAEAAPTLLVIIPLLTVLGIASLRINHGMHTQFDMHFDTAHNFVMLGGLLAVQLLIALVGWNALKAKNYVASFLSQEGQKSAGAYALVCPGVALSVMVHFFVNKGLVGAGLIAKFGVAYWAFTLPALAFQIAMIVLVVRLNKQHFSTTKILPHPAAAE